jgi:hypothetical protein
MRLLVVLIAALVLAPAAGAAEILARNAKGIRLATDDQGRAMVTYTTGSKTWHAFVYGAINARQPSRTQKQVKFTIDYSGGRGEWKQFKNTCQRYDGPSLGWLVGACKASDGSYWALQTWKRMLPNVGYAPWLGYQNAYELHISHWSGEIAELEVYNDWIFGNRFHEIFGRASYRGEGIHGFGSTKKGVPTDTYGRLIFLDTFNSAYGPGWKRENSFLAHNPSGMFCYGFYPRSSYGSYPNPRNEKLDGHSKKYRLTLSGPGVTPDILWVGDGLQEFDKQNPALVDWESAMNDKRQELRAAYGENGCGTN